MLVSNNDCDMIKKNYQKGKKRVKCEVAEKLHSLIDVLESADNLWDMAVL